MAEPDSLPPRPGRGNGSFSFEPDPPAPEAPPARPPAAFPRETAERSPNVSNPLGETQRDQKPTRIKVIGVGGAGCNAVQSMVDQGFEGVEFYALNTDAQALSRCRVANRLQIGQDLTQNSGAGADPAIGEKAARDAEPRIREILKGADMVFITCGLGGGTGTGAAPVISEIARDMGILNVAIVTKPFQFEGTQRMRRALEGQKKLVLHVDTLISILNDKLIEVVGAKTPLTEAFEVANGVLAQGIRAISDLIAMPGLINVDFRDVRTIMGETGGAVMGVGVGKGENRAVEAVRKACHSPLQEKIVIDGARGVLINITGPADVTMHEISEATSLIYEMADPEANVIFGVVIDESMHDAMRVTIIATGFPSADISEQVLAAQPERLRPRPGALTSPPAPGRLTRPADAEAPEGPSEIHRPAILTKREREATPPAPPRIDFKSPDNPLRELNPERGAEPADEQRTPTARALQPEPSPAIAKGSIFSDVETADEAPSSDDPYDIPPLSRRRRQHLFE